MALTAQSIPWSRVGQSRSDDQKLQIRERLRVLSPSEGRVDGQKVRESQTKE